EIRTKQTSNDELPRSAPTATADEINACATGLRPSDSHKRVAAYAICSQRHHNRLGNHFGHWAGTRGRVRFNSTLGKYWTLSRRANTSDLRCAVTAERLLHGASQRRSFQIDRLRPHVAANLRRSANGVDRCDRRFDFGSERRLRGQWRRITSAGSLGWGWDL